MLQCLLRGRFVQQSANIALVLVPFAKYVDCCWLMMAMDAVLEDLGIAQQATSVL